MGNVASGSFAYINNTTKQYSSSQGMPRDTQPPLHVDVIKITIPLPREIIILDLVLKLYQAQCGVMFSFKFGLVVNLYAKM